MDTSADTKKIILEDLSKDEIIAKYKGLLNILQKAKQSKNLLLEENNNLKQQLQKRETVNPTEEILEKFTQQKLELATTLEEVKKENEKLKGHLRDRECDLHKAEHKISELDTEVQSYQRQLNRVTNENEQLLHHLDSLEKQIEELKRIGVLQQQQLLDLEKSSDGSKDLKSELESLVEINKNLNLVNQELCNNNTELVEKQNILIETIETQNATYQAAEILINDLKQTIHDKDKQNENYLNTADDLNIELHKNKALVEKLRQDIVSMSSRLSDSQIISSGVTSDLQNTNEKLKNKLKLYHSKIIKFATDIKELKQQKVAILDDFKVYIHQVRLWEEQLKVFSTSILSQFKDLRVENNKLQTENGSLKNQIENLQGSDSQVNQLKLDNKYLTNELNKYVDQNEVLKNKVESERTLFQQNSSVLTNEIRILKEKQEKGKHTLEEIQQEKQIEIKHLQNKIETILKENKNYNESILNLKEHLSKINNDYQTLTENNERTLIQNNELKQKHQEDTNQIETLTNKINELQKELNILKTIKLKLAEQSASDIRILLEENKILLDKNRCLEHDKAHKLGSGSQVKELDGQINIIKKENSELLFEMNEMNQILKERGETISKQQEYCDELLHNIKLFESQANKSTEIIRQKEEIIMKLEQDINLLKNQSQSSSSFNEMHGNIVEKDEEIAELKNELTLLKERLDLSHETNYAESETMSTSTISRTDEMNRFKDLEGSWEERYGKLRSLALKLKGKIRDLTNELTKEQNEKVDLQQKLITNIKSVQNMQSQYDKVQDELEQSRIEIKNLLKKLDLAAVDIVNTKKLLAENDELITKLKADVAELNKEKTKMDTWKKQVGIKVNNLKKELEANGVLKKDFEEQIAKLNAQLETKDKLLKSEIDKHNTTKSSLQESNNECKKQSVMNLEMQDYERSLKDLTQKLDKKQELVSKLKNQIDSEKNFVNTVKEQNRLLEEHIQNVESDLTGARNEIQAYRKTISDLELIITQKDDKLQDLTRSLESYRTTNEDLAVKLSKIVSENQKVLDSIKSEREYLRSQNLGLEQKLQEIRDNLKLKDEELKTLQGEYHKYKVRAQSVLRQSQTRDIGLEEKLSEEVESFKAKVAILTTELNEFKISMDVLKEDNKRLIVENKQFEVMHQQLINDLEDLQKQKSLLSKKHQEIVSEYSETIRSLKVHAETLSQCYRQQLSEQEVRHNREIIELQGKIDKVGPVASEVPLLIPPTLPREQGEGSENVDIKQSFKTQPVPLDLLLSSEHEQDVGFVKKQLTENEAKVMYLTALLADTEQDLVKHVQMNKLLKEEIRRQQRSVEREQHAENLEYLKNVVFKFATLSSGDERSRLVPVLNTILKFSPEETSQLNMVAKGEHGSKTWSNYLPVWS